MSFCVLQTRPPLVDAAKLAAALRSVPGFPEPDLAPTLAEAAGVLVRGWEAAPAADLQAALAARGVPAVVRPDGLLPALPPPHGLHQLFLADGAIVLLDALGRRTEWPGAALGWLAAGRVRGTEFSREVTERIVNKRMGRHYSVPKVVVETVTREAPVEHWVLEFMPRDASRRYPAVADRPETALLFQCLGENKTRNPAANLLLLLRELAARAPAAELNEGARRMLEEGDLTYVYPTKTAFEREQAWRLWRAAGGL